MRNRENNSNKDTKKSLEDYDHHRGSRKQASEFEATTKVIINHVQENLYRGRNIAEALRMIISLNTDEWMPSISEIPSDDEATRNRE